MYVKESLLFLSLPRVYQLMNYSNQIRASAGRRTIKVAPARALLTLGQCIIAVYEKPRLSLPEEGGVPSIWA